MDHVRITGVYILQSLKNLRYYIGSTNQIDVRVGQHNSGLVKATRHMRPWLLKAFIECQTLTDARKAEYRLKKYKSRMVVEKTIHDGVFPWKYTQ